MHNDPICQRKPMILLSLALRFCTCMHSVFCGHLLISLMLSVLDFHVIRSTKKYCKLSFPLYGEV